MTDTTPEAPQPPSLADFLDARYAELDVHGPEAPDVHEAFTHVVAAFRAADDPRSAQMAAASNALAWVALALAQPFADHPDFQSAWRTR